MRWGRGERTPAAEAGFGAGRQMPGINPGLTSETTANAGAVAVATCPAMICGGAWFIMRLGGESVSRRLKPGSWRGGKARDKSRAYLRSNGRCRSGRGGDVSGDDLRGSLVHYALGRGERTPAAEAGFVAGESMAGLKSRPFKATAFRRARALRTKPAIKRKNVAKGR